MSAYEAQCAELWRTLGPARAAFFATLDTFLFEEIGYRHLGDSGTDLLYENGFKQIGDIVGVTRSEVMKRCGLTWQKASRVDRILTELGLSYATDVTGWKRYRARVPRLFRLEEPSRRYSRGLQGEPSSYGHSAAQPARHI